MQETESRTILFNRDPSLQEMQSIGVLQKGTLQSSKNLKPTMLNQSYKISVWSIVALLACIVGCTNSTSNDSANAGITVIATTGQIHSALQHIVEGTPTTLKLFCGPGVDPHSFSASFNDVQAMVDADLIVYNGYHLEAKLDEHLHGTFKEKSWSMASAFPTSNRLDWVEDGKTDPAAPFDPHVWNDLPGWAKSVQALTDHLVEIDGQHAALYRENSTKYIAKLKETHQWAKSKLDKIPEDRRTIISAHDAFGYFAKNYGMKTSAPLGVSNDAEADIQKIREIAQLICQEKIPAIFLETITNAQVTRSLSEACEARGWKVNIVQQPLYSDDLGESAPYNTFLGAFRSNVDVIFAALSNEEDAE